MIYSHQYDFSRKKIYTLNGTIYEEINTIYTVSSTIYAVTNMILAEKRYLQSTVWFMKK